MDRNFQRRVHNRSNPKTQSAPIPKPRVAMTMDEAIAISREIALQAADELIDGKIGWHGREAVAAVLLETR